MTQNPVIPKVTEAEVQSADPITENIAALKALFPEAAGETGVRFDVLRQILGDASAIEEGEERFGLNWHGKKRARQIGLTPTTATLRPCREESVNWDETENLFIEGDNLEVLKLLQRGYAGKIKMIYIDPPYNTDKDFIYPDKFSEGLEAYLHYTGQRDGAGWNISGEGQDKIGRKHTNWLNMMYPRLTLAKNLLTQDGVIFISIDDHEQARLKLLCDEVFGEENFVAELCWRRRKTQANLVKHIAPVHDFIMLYGKTQNIKLSKLPYSKDFIEKTFSNPDNDERGLFQTRPLAQPQNSSNPEYELELPNGRKILAKWSCSKETFKKYLFENRVYIPSGGEGMPRLKIFLSESDGIIPNTWLEGLATTEEGSAQLNSLFDKKIVFDFPKPVNLLKHFLSIGSTQLNSTQLNDMMILDFFAGSGTTAHAVMQLNAEDGGKRRCISVQLPEKCDEKSEAFKAGYATIAEISKERIRRAAKKIKADNPDYSGDLGFKVFKLAESGIKPWEPAGGADLVDQMEKQIETVRPDRTEEDLLYQLFLMRGVPLAVPVESRKFAGKKVFSVGYGSSFACFDREISLRDIDTLCEGIAAWRDELKPEDLPHLFFRDDAFKDDVTKINLLAALEQLGFTRVKSL